MARKKRRAMAEMNVVPYIDVMLVLLVIFMVTAPMLKQGVQVDLPDASNDPVEATDNLEPLIVSIDESGKTYLNRGDDDQMPQSFEAIQSQISAELTKEPKTPVLVGGDEGIAYGKVIELMGLLKSAGVPKVGLLTELPSN